MRTTNDLRRRYLTQTPHQTALRTVAGPAGCLGQGVIALATGAGLLLDFFFIGLHPVFSAGLLLVSVPIGFYISLYRVIMDQQRPNSGTPTGQESAARAQARVEPHVNPRVAEKRAAEKLQPVINADYVRNLALASVAGQSGCLTVLFIFAGLFGGMFLDAQLDTHPVFTIALVLLVVPLSLYATVRLMLSSVSALRMEGGLPHEETKESDS